jgi:hypothetical protein
MLTSEETCPVDSVPLHVHIEKTQTQTTQDDTQTQQACDQVTVKRFCVNEDTSLQYLEQQVTSAMIDDTQSDIKFEWSWMKEADDDQWATFSCEEEKREEEWKDAIHNHRDTKACAPMRLRVRAVPARKHGCKSLGCRKTQHHQKCSIRSAWKMVGAASNYCNNLVQQDSLLGCPFAFLKDIIQSTCTQKLCPKMMMTCTANKPIDDIVDADITETEEKTCERSSEYALQHESLAMMGFESSREQWEINEQLLVKKHGCLRSTMDALYKLHK